MEEITREKIMSAINDSENVREYVECRIAELLGVRCSTKYDCKACTMESMKIIVNAWEKDISECMAAALKDVPSKEE